MIEFFLIPQPIVTELARRQHLRCHLLLLIATLLLSAPLYAHTIRPSVVTVSFTADTEFDVLIKANLEALIAQIGDDHEDTDDAPNAEDYNRLRALPPDQLRPVLTEFLPDMLAKVDATLGGTRATLQFIDVQIPPIGDTDLARDSNIYLRGTAEKPGAFVWRWPASYGSNVLRIAYAGSDPVQAMWLQAGEVNEPFVPDAEALPRSWLDVVQNYFVIGFTHIVPKGMDHILFVLGIFLFSASLGPVLWQVTAFTVAHTITLGMSSLGILSVPANIVEPIIALSIVYIGIENTIARRLTPWRILLVFCFGLLHGLGFAGVLAEIGLPKTEFITALISFNVGVEGGQLAVIMLAAVLLVPFRNKPWYRNRMTIPLSLMIAVVGLYWTVQRIS